MWNGTTSPKRYNAAKGCLRGPDTAAAGSAELVAREGQNN